MIRHIYLLFLLSLLAITGVWAQTTRYVKETATGTGLGTNWNNASADLQAMIDASDPNGRVFVAAGTYRPTVQRPTTIGAGVGNAGKTFFIKSGVKVYGGFAGTPGTEFDLSGRTLTPSSSILSGDSNSPFTRSDDVYHVVTFLDAGTATHLDGFIVTKGWAVVESATLLDNIGAAIYNKSTASGSSRPTIANCLINDNYAVKGGAGLANYAVTGGDASPTVINCQFSDNRGESLGGAVLNYAETFNADKNTATYTSCTFSDNRSSLGGGVYNQAVLPRFTNCIFEKNRAQGQVEAPFGQIPNPGKGGGMYSTSGSRPTLLSCTFKGNIVEEAEEFSDSEGGGGLYNDDNTRSSLINCLIVNNTARRLGAGVYNASGTLSLTNCTIADNNNASAALSGFYESGGSSQWLNSIIWNRNNYRISGFNANSSASYSVIGVWDGLSGSNNLDTNPLFVDAANANYRLQISSPAIDSGDPASTVGNVSATDLGGDSRVQGRIDRGAYEQTAATPPGSPTISGGTSQSTCQGTDEVTISASCPVGSTPSFRTGTGGIIVQASFTVNTQQPGVWSYTAVCTSNSSGLTSTLPFSLTVVGTPDAPTVSRNPASGTITAGNSVSLTASCPSGSVPVWNVASTQGVVITPTEIGTYNYQVNCLTSGGCTSLNIAASATVVIAPTPPGSPTVSGGTVFCQDNNSSDAIFIYCPAGSRPSYIDNGGPISGGTIIIRQRQAGVQSYTAVCMSNSSELTSTLPFSITVVGTPGSPTVSLNPASGTATAGNSVSLTASCPAGTTPIWSVTSTSPGEGSEFGPIGLAVVWREVSTLGTLVTPTAIGTYNYRVKCCTPNGCNSLTVAASATVVIAPTPPNSPTVSGGTAQSTCQGAEEFTIFASCPVGSTPSFRTVGGPLNQDSFVINTQQAGIQSYTAVCTSNSSGLTSTLPFLVTVVGTPDAPTVSLNPASGMATAGNSVSLTASCPSGSTPVWNVASTLGVVITPTTIGTYNYQVNCRTPGGCTSPATPASATVVIAPTPPGPPTVSVSTSLCQDNNDVTIFASCPVGSTPSFIVNGSPISAGFIFVSKRQAGVQSYTAVCTSNSSGLTSTLPFSITVVERPAAPTVSLNPASGTATAGNSVSLTASCPAGSTPVWSATSTSPGEGSEFGPIGLAVVWREVSTLGTLVTPTAIGTYNYRVNCRTPDGCNSLTVAASATVVAVPPNTFPAADLSIPKVDVTRREQTAGQRVRYVTHLLNQSNVTATNVRFRVQMPAGYAYSTDNSMTTDPTSVDWVGTPTSPNTSYDAATNQVNVLVPSIGPGQRLLLFFYGFVPMTTGRNYQFWEIVSADNPDPDSTPDNGFCNGEDDTYSIDTRVGIPITVGADVVVFNNVSTSNANPAQNDVITISTGIRNNEGPEVATNVLTKITLPAGLSFVAATTPGVSYSSGNREVAYNATRIGINEAVSFSFTAKVVAASGSRIRVRAEVKSGDQVSYNAQFGNEQCNNDDDDTGETTITVSGITVVPPSGVFSITGVTPVSCATVTAGLRQVTFTPQYAGLSGQPVSFSVVGELATTTAAGPYTLSLYTDNPVITLKATQSGTSGEASFTYNWLTACNGSGTPPVNQAPVVANGIPNQTAAVGQLFSYLIPANTFSDPNGDALSVAVTGLPAGLSLLGSTISGTPSVSGVSTITVTATDPGSLAVSTSFVLTVTPAPVVVIPSGVFSITGVTPVSCATVTAGLRTVTFTPQYAGLSGQPVSFSVVSELATTTAAGPYTLSLYTDNPVITLKATQSGTAGDASFTYNWLTACNGGGTPPVNQAPVVANSIPNQTATVGQLFSYLIPANTFSDPNGDALSVAVAGLPAGLSLAGSTISGTPSVSGVSTITVTATDPGSLAVSTSFVLTVNPAPVVVIPSGVFSITGVTTVSCATVTAGLRTLTFTPRYAGLSGQPVSFSVVSEMLPTTAAGPYTLNIYTDNPVITLKATQSGTAGDASFTYNWLTNCNSGSSGRLAALTSRESALPLKVSVLGNPVVGETVRLDVRGAEGQPLRVWVSNLQGHLISEQHIEQAETVERISLQLSRSVGLYLLQVSSPTQTKVVRVLKTE